MLLAIWGPPKLATHNLAMHLCGNPKCLNPLHLAWGTISENCVRDKAEVVNIVNNSKTRRYGWFKELTEGTPPPKRAKRN